MTRSAGGGMAQASVDGMTPVLMLHIGWARDYHGARSDPPQGKFGYMKESGVVVGEAVNFKSFGGTCYGYSPHWRLDPRRLGGEASDEAVDHVLVVFTATNPDGSGRYVVGWYRDALVHVRMQRTRPDARRPDYLVEAAAKDAHVVPVDERTFAVPTMRSGWPGVASAFYASDVLPPAQLDRLRRYVGGERSSGFEETGGDREPGRGSPRQPDPTVRVAVENAAMLEVRHHYEALGYAVRDVSRECLGWDLEAVLGRRRLLAEVKGRSGTGSVELTPNEYRAMTDPRSRMRFRIAIVHHALSPTRRLRVFAFRPGDGSWRSEDGETLHIRVMEGAVLDLRGAGDA